MIARVLKEWKDTRRRQLHLSIVVWSLVAVVVAFWAVRVEWGLPAEEPFRDYRRFAAAVREAAPRPAPVVFFQTEAHALAFHVGRPLSILVEWEELQDRLAADATTYVVMPPASADAWPNHLTGVRLREVLKNTDLSGGRHERPTRTAAGRTGVHTLPDVPQLPPIAAQPLSVVLLAHDCAAHLEQIVAEWVTFLNGLDREYEILLVDDGSTDHTERLLAVLKDRHVRLRVLSHPEHRGEGAALRTALATARYPLLFWTVCDPRYRSADLKRLLKEIDRVHLVSGYRAGRPVPRFWRWVGGMRRGFGWLVLGHADLALARLARLETPSRPIDRPTPVRRPQPRRDLPVPAGPTFHLRAHAVAV